MNHKSGLVLLFVEQRGRQSQDHFILLPFFESCYRYSWGKFLFVRWTPLFHHYTCGLTLFLLSHSPNYNLILYSFEYFLFLKKKKRRDLGGYTFSFLFSSLFYHSKFASCESKILLSLSKFWWKKHCCFDDCQSIPPLFYFYLTIHNCQCINILTYLNTSIVEIKF